MIYKHVVVINVVGLSPRHLEKPEIIPNISSLANDGLFSPLQPPACAVTCSSQATFTTGCHPTDHGIVANGFFDRDKFKVSFWDQENNLVQRPRIWEVLKNKHPDFKTAVLFWQHTLFANSDLVITPKPLHSDEGLVQWCYSKPVGYYEEIASEKGPFNLMTYWGPMASLASSQWVTNCANYTLNKHNPNLTLIYLPHLDYGSQRFGIENEKEEKDLQAVDNLVGEIVKEVNNLPTCEETAIVIISDYSLLNVNGGIDLNRILRKEKLLKIREIGGKEYIDFELSNAFAMVDHQIAHIYIKDGFVDRVKSLLNSVEGIETVWDQKEKAEHNINHKRSGELIAISKKDKWFAYYWWEETEKMPGFARTVDIHNKPGYDPLELFFDPVSKSIPQNMNLIRGSHGSPYLEKNEKAVFIINGRDIRSRIKEEITDSVQVFKTILSLFD